MRIKTRTRQAIVLRIALAITIGALVLSSAAKADSRTITVASTTSTQNSGLFEWLLPQFTAESGIEVQVVAVGTSTARWS